MRALLLPACLAGLAAGAAAAADLDIGSGPLAGTTVRLDTTLRETLAVRADGQDGAILANPNADDGDRAFASGLVSSRLDVVSQLDVAQGDLGLSVSAEGWLDPLYLGRDDDRSAATFNPVSVPVDRHPQDVRRLEGASVELLDGFVHDQAEIAGLPLSVRIGRQTRLWGESLFFAQNGIAAGQAPVDAIKAAGDPLAEARELFLPVAQAWASLDLGSGFSIEAYDQFEWRRDRLPGVTSYFSTADFLDVGGEQLFLNGQALGRVADRVPHGAGQFGVALHYTSGMIDAGLYALRFDAKAPEVFTQAGGYGLVFPRGIALYGASFGGYAGNVALGGEISARQSMPLVSRLGPAGGSGAPGGVSTGGFGGVYGYLLAATPVTYGPVAYGPPPAAYAAGDTLHAQVSATSVLPPGRLWRGAALAAEIAANDLLETTSGAAALAAGRTRFAASLRVSFEPQYFQVLPGLDVSIPLGLGTTLAGRSSVDASQNQGAGDVEIGISGVLRATWSGRLIYTRFVGGSTAQPLADRSFVALTVARSF